MPRKRISGEKSFSLLRVEGKTDAADAVTLARLASGFHLRISNMPDEMQTHLRLYLRTHDKTSAHRTRLLIRQ